MIIETQYNTGDTVWVMHNNRACKGAIDKIWFVESVSCVTCDMTNTNRTVSYSVNVEWGGSIVVVTGFVAGKTMFDTKEELIKSL